MKRKLFDLTTLDLEKFRDILRITSQVVHKTGLPSTGTRFDCGVIGFGVTGSEDDYVSYNLDNDWLFINESILTGEQIESLKEIADTFDLTIREFDHA